MKVKIPMILVSLIILYLVLPVGEYSPDDVNKQNNRNALYSFTTKLVQEEFVESVEGNLIPDTGFILLPVTMISKDGDNAFKGAPLITSGYNRSDGSYHSALDITTRNSKMLRTCLAGRADCSDTALLAPVSGTVISVRNNVGKERQYYGSRSDANNSFVGIKADGAFTGRVMSVLHLTSIPSHIVNGYKIQQGEYIGTICSQGNSTGPHLHFIVGTEISQQTDGRPFGEWFDKLQLHKSVTNITTSQPIGYRGFSKEQLDALNARPRYEGDVIIPSQYIVK